MIRWTFHDPDGRLPDYTVPINPNEMSNPHTGDALVTFGLSATLSGIQGRRQPQQWTFAGVLHTQTHYEALAAWCELGGRLQLADHLGRTFWVQLVAFEPTQTRSRTRPWRHRYTVRAQTYGEVT